MRGATRVLILALPILGMVAVDHPAEAAGKRLERVDVGPDGQQAEPFLDDTEGSVLSMSADGRFVAFSSGAGNLVAGDTNGREDVFVHDRRTRTTERVSIASNGRQAQGGPSYDPSLSADGRFVAFASSADDLVPGDTNGLIDIFVHDRRTRRTERVSVSSSGAQGDNHSNSGSISADGRFVAFKSGAANLVPGDDNRFRDVFLRDRVAGTTERVSVSSDGGQGNGDMASDDASVSAHGRFVAFSSESDNLVRGDSNGRPDVFVRDRRSGRTERVSVSSSGAQGDGASRGGCISSDGRFVVFRSEATNLVPGDTNGGIDIFVHDRRRRTTERVNVSTLGAEDDGGIPLFNRVQTLTPDGRFVIFASPGTTLVPRDTNATWDVFLRDRIRATTTRLSVNARGLQANNGSNVAAMSADGRFVAFGSLASNLVPRDTNDDGDIFVRRR